MRKHFAVLALLVALGSNVKALVFDEWQVRTQPDGTTFTAHFYGDEISSSQFTSDGYAFVYRASDGYYYYAELDAQGEYVASAAKVGIDNPSSYGIQKNLQRSAVRLAEIESARIAQGYADDPNNQVKGEFGDPSHFVCSSSNPCDAYVVLVTFDDAVTWYDTRGGDTPYGYSWDLFNQFFNGGYDDLAAYEGQITHSAVGHPDENLEVFGSLRAYFHEVHGEDIIRFTILNREDADEQPVWLELPGTKEYYAANIPATFWNDADAAVLANTGGALGAVPADFPYQTAPAPTQLANKVIYVYAGNTVTVSSRDSNRNSALHPRVNHVTESATVVGDIGARYVMGERQGFSGYNHVSGGNPDSTVTHFTGIGLHVHEWGHLFGFDHPDGSWRGRNPHHTPNPTRTYTRANLLGWGSMQSGAHGPILEGDSGYSIPHRSAPNPYNPFFRRDLGWNNTETISASVIGRQIDPSPEHIYVVRGDNSHEYILDFRAIRTDRSFGQYTGYHRFTESPGLLIWRRLPVPIAT